MSTTSRDTLLTKLGAWVGVLGLVFTLIFGLLGFFGVGAYSVSYPLFTADKDHIVRGDTILLKWVAQEPDSLVFLDGTPVQPSDEKVVRPNGDRVYVLRVQRIFLGKAFASESRVAIKVDPPPITATMEVYPSQVSSGTPVVISWRTKNADTAEIEPSGLIGPVGPTGRRTLTVTETTTFRLVASAAGMVQSTQATVEVLHTDLDFSANLTTIHSGDPVTLAWKSNVQTVKIAPDIGEVPSSGNYIVRPATTTTYEALATGIGGEIRRNITIQVLPPLPPAVVILDPEATGASDDLAESGIQRLSDFFQKQHYAVYRGYQGMPASDVYRQFPELEAGASSGKRPVFVAKLVLDVRQGQKVSTKSQVASAFLGGLTGGTQFIEANSMCMATLTIISLPSQEIIATSQSDPLQQKKTIPVQQGWEMTQHEMTELVGRQAVEEAMSRLRLPANKQ